MIETWEQQVDFVRSMPIAAAKILWILFISGRSLTGKELQYACDMAEKTIDKGLNWLEPRRLIQNNGKFNGWSLTAVAHQLPLPFQQLTVEHQNALPAPHGAATPQNRDGESSTVGKNRSRYGFPTFAPGENRTGYGFLSSSSDLLPEERDLEEEETRENRSRYGFVDETVRQMLIDAGIGPRSRKLTELLALGLDVDFVAAHVHVWQRRDEPLGYLITRLESGDTPPVCNCPDCRIALQIPPELADIIKR